MFSHVKGRVMEHKTIVPEMCECGRMYKDRRDKDGKMMCSACYTGLDVDCLKKLWSAPEETLNP